MSHLLVQAQGHILLGTAFLGRRGRVCHRPPCVKRQPVVVGGSAARSPGPRLAPVLASAEAPAAAAAAPAPLGPVSQAPEVWRSAWWPVAFLRDVPLQAPYAFVLLGEPIVVWRDGTGEYHCFRDACPHRLVPLSEGRVAADGMLECAYHGWKFEGCGTCSVMPQSGDFTANPRARATAYQCAVLQGLVWVKLQPAPAGGAPPSTADVPVLPELDDPAWCAGAGDTFRDFPYSYESLLENLIDIGHVPFTHHASISKRQSSGDFSDMRVTEKGAWGFKGTWPTGPRRGALGAQDTLFHAPGLMRHTIDAFDTRGFANITCAYAVPTTPGRCRAFVRQPFKFKSKLVPLAFAIFPKWLGHLSNNDVLNEDIDFLHRQEAEAVRRGIGASGKPIGQVYFMPGASDAYVAAFRSWLAASGGGGPFGPQDTSWLAAAGPRLPLHQLLDHYHIHTEKCSICRPALRRMKVARAVAGALAAACGVVAIIACTEQLLAAQLLLPGAAEASAARQVTGAPLLWLAAKAAALAAVFGLLWRWCTNTVVRFYTGSHPPSRNRVGGEFEPMV